MAGFVVNPSAPEIWSANAVLNGKSRRHSVPMMAGTLSVKTVLQGEATWSTPEGSYRIDPDTLLILNDGQSYDLQIDSETPVETFCLFFQPEFFSSVLARDLAPEPLERQSPGFYERKRLKAPAFLKVILDIQILMKENTCGGLEAEDALASAASALLAERELERLEMEGLHCASFATRIEVFRLLNLARDFMLSNLNRPLKLEEIAGIACLSPFHFHRLHRQAFQETPHEFVTRARIARASRMLKSGQAASDVSLNLGFESVPSFTRLFKKHMGMTPGAFSKIG